MRHGQHRSQPLQVYIAGANVMMRWHREFSDLTQRIFHRLADYCYQRGLRLRGPAVDKIKNLSLRLSHDGGVRLGGEVANTRRMPVIAPRQTALLVHALLHHRPFARLRDHKRVQVELKSIADRIIVHTRGKPARASEFLTMQAGSLGKIPQLIRRTNRMTSSAATNRSSQIAESRIQSTLQRAHHGCCDAGRMPVHSHYATQRLKPEWIA